MTTRPTRPKRNTAARKKPHAVRVRGRQRMEDRLAISWEPLSELEMRSLNSVRDGQGKYAIDRQLLAKLMGERERLSFVAEAARWLVESCEDAGLERMPKDRVTPTRVELAMGATRQAIKSYDGDRAAARRFPPES